MGEVISNRSRAATVPLIGGHPALDLVNTVSWRGAPSRAQDHLQSAADCLTWLARAGVVTETEADTLATHLRHDPRAGQRLRRGLRELRSVVADTLAPPRRASVESLERPIRAALRHSSLVADEASEPNRYRWRVDRLDEHTPARRIALGLLDLLTTPRGRIAACADDECRWVYLDTSHARNRQWCDSADCGNRNRVRRHQRAARLGS